jgi:hypothetical protein
MSERDGPTDGYPPGVETETVAGVAVPTSCHDRIDEAVLADAVAVLQAHSVVHYQVSPVGGLKIFLGVHRPEAEYRSLRERLEETTYGLREHSVADGFYRLRAALIDPESG